MHSENDCTGQEILHEVEKIIAGSIFIFWGTFNNKIPQKSRT